MIITAIIAWLYVAGAFFAAASVLAMVDNPKPIHAALFTILWPISVLLLIVVVAMASPDNADQHGAKASRSA
ncbi:MAG: hypothetical protein WA975_18175 [Mesorhizobium sp.]